MKTNNTYSFLYVAPEAKEVKLAQMTPMCLAVSTQGSKGTGIDDYDIDDTVLLWD